MRSISAAYEKYEVSHTTTESPMMKSYIEADPNDYKTSSQNVECDWPVIYSAYHTNDMHIRPYIGHHSEETKGRQTTKNMAPNLQKRYTNTRYQVRTSRRRSSRQITLEKA